MNIVTQPNISQTKSIENVQKFILRDIVHDYKANYKDLLEKFRLQSLRTRREIRIVKIILNIRNATANASPHFAKFLVFKEGGPTNRLGIKLKEEVIKFSRFMIGQFSVRIFNQLPYNIRTNFNLTNCLNELACFYGFK